MTDKAAVAALAEALGTAQAIRPEPRVERHGVGTGVESVVWGPATLVQGWDNQTLARYILAALPAGWTLIRDEPVAFEAKPGDTPPDDYARTWYEAGRNTAPDAAQYISRDECYRLTVEAVTAATRNADAQWERLRAADAIKSEIEKPWRAALRATVEHYHLTTHTLVHFEYCAGAVCTDARALLETGQ